MGSAYIIENQADTSLKIAAIDFTIKVCMHVIYERIWQHISWGSNSAPMPSEQV